MKLKFIGVGSAFTTSEYYQSNALVTSRTGKKLLIDCGTDIRFSLAETSVDGNPNDDIDAIYITHLHSDHIGGMEWMAFTTFFNPNKEKPVLFMEENVMADMWNYCLKGGLGCIEGKRMHLTDFFECRAAPGGGAFTWEGIRFTMVKMRHIVTGYKNLYSHGLLMEEIDTGGPMIFFSSDTQFQPDFIREIAERTSVIFHDCETSPFKSGVHAHYDELATLPKRTKRKIWLYHYQPRPGYKAEEDGFRGFVKKKQEFDFTRKPPYTK